MTLEQKETIVYYLKNLVERQKFEGAYKRDQAQKSKDTPYENLKLNIESGFAIAMAETLIKEIETLDKLYENIPNK